MRFHEAVQIVEWNKSSPSFILGSTFSKMSFDTASWILRQIQTNPGTVEPHPSVKSLGTTYQQPVTTVQQQDVVRSTHQPQIGGVHEDVRDSGSCGSEMHWSWTFHVHSTGRKVSATPMPVFYWTNRAFVFAGLYCKSSSRWGNDNISFATHSFKRNRIVLLY